MIPSLRQQAETGGEVSHSHTPNTETINYQQNIDEDIVTLNLLAKIKICIFQNRIMMLCLQRCNDLKHLNKYKVC